MLSEFEDYRRRDFAKTEPEILQGLIRRAEEESEEYNRFMREIKEAGIRIADFLYRTGFLERIEIPYSIDRVLARKHYVGIDGSFYVTGGKGKRYYIMMTAVIIELPKGIDTSPNELIKRYPGIDIRVYDDVSGGKEVFEVAEDLMMQLETRAIEVKVDEYDGSEQYVFIDGPVIDPPRLPSKYIIDREDLKYIDYRAKVFRKAYEKGLSIYGYVKSARTDNLLKKKILDLASRNLSGKEYQEIEDALDKFASDQELAFITLFTILSITERRYNNKYVIYATKPVDIEDTVIDENEIYKEYKSRGLTVYYTYAISRYMNKVYRLEVMVPNNTSPEEVRNKLIHGIKLVSAITLPGHKHPLPIILAHEKCRIRRGAAEIIYEEILARTARPTGDNLLDQLKYLIIREE